MGVGFYVTGGKQRPPDRQYLDWDSYEKGVILHVDIESRKVNVAVEYISPEEVVAPEVERATMFKAGCVVGDKIYVCTSTEVLVYSVPDFQQVCYITHPWFNDLHHVTPAIDGNLVVVNTGLDMVMLMSPEGECLKAWSVNDDSLWERFSPETDWRRVATTKPHKSHPNFAYCLDGELWVTRCHEKDACCVSNHEKRMEVAVQYIHDGVVDGNRVYFTTVDGRIAIVDAVTRSMVEIIDLNGLDGEDKPLGWCRGIRPLDESTVIVGFSRVRRTKFREKLAWLKHVAGVNNRGVFSPARIALYDIKKKRLLHEIALEDHGIDALFSILPDGT